MIRGLSTTARRSLAAIGDEVCFLPFLSNNDTLSLCLVSEPTSLSLERARMRTAPHTGRMRALYLT